MYNHKRVWFIQALFSYKNQPGFRKNDILNMKNKRKEVKSNDKISKSG